jgi:hypothetical protein
LPTYSALLAARNATIYGLKRTELNKNSTVEMAIIETKKPQKGDLFDVISQTVNCIKEG